MTIILSCFVDMLVTHPKHTSELLDYWMNDIVNAITYVCIYSCQLWTSWSSIKWKS